MQSRTKIEQATNKQLMAKICSITNTAHANHSLSRAPARSSG